MLDVDITSAGPIGLALRARVEPGRCLALVGPSGAGKTTALRAIAGLTPAEGEVACHGRSWAALPAERRAVGMVFQDHALFGHLSAWRNVAYGMRGLDRAARRSAAVAQLERFGIARLADARPRELSGGERQRVALARALARDPEVLLLDEPLASLDTRTRASAMGVLASALRESGLPAVLVTHDFGEAAQLADEIAVIDNGRVVQRGTAAELGAAPASAFVADLTGAVVLLGHADGTRVRLDGGGEVASTDEADGPVALAVHPWDITLEPAGTLAHGSARNRLRATVTTVTVLGNRARVGLQAGQPLVAEVTPEAVEQLGLRPGLEAIAVFKASAARVTAR